MEFMLSNMHDISSATDKTLSPIDIIVSLWSVILKILWCLTGLELFHARKHNRITLKEIDATSGKHKLRVKFGHKAKSKRNKLKSCLEWFTSLGRVTAKKQLFAAAKELLETKKTLLKNTHR